MHGVAALLALQQAVAAPGTPPAAGSRPLAERTATTATAVRALHPPVIDGRDDDEVWRLVPAITRFKGSTSYSGDGSYQADVRDLFRLHPLNTFLVKASYWLNW
jgi:hypothetical protein